MIAELLFRLALVMTSTRDSEALARTAPETITLDVSRENVAASRAAAILYDVDPDLLLSIAAHESRYDHRAVTPERGGLVSCGVMTPTPVASCEKAPSILDGYLAGARHLRVDWLSSTRTKHEALLGYAGGWTLINACREGPVISVRANGEIDLCNTDKVFLWRASWIRRERMRGGPTS